jgi:hypothetical protein
MENEEIVKEIKFLKVTYNIHIFVYIFLLMIYLIVSENIYWLVDSILQMFQINLYIFFCFYLFIIGIYIFFGCTTLTEKKINFYIKISLALFFISTINSLFCSIICCYNSTLFPSFYTDCPFNFKIDYIPKMINVSFNNEKKMKNICKARKCFNINNNTDIYLCNFPEEKNYINSFSENDTNEIEPEIVNFAKYCKEFANFSLNQKDKYKIFSIDYSFPCPSKTNIAFNFSLTYLFIFSILFCTGILWLFEYCSYKYILALIRHSRNNNNSLRDTNNTSKINEDNNQDNISNTNKTEIIIVENSKNDKNNKIEENNNVSNEISKSENQLMDNLNKNIFKFMNQNDIQKNDKK